MKKVFLLLVFVLLFNKEISANQNNIRDYGKYIVFEDYNIYFVAGFYLDDFMDNTSLNFLDDVSRDKYRYIRYVKETKMSYLTYNEDEDNIFNTLVIADDPLYGEESLKYLSNENISKVLKNNGIFDDVKTVALIDFDWNAGDYTPTIVWINTVSDANYYLIWEYSAINQQFEGRPDFSKIKLSTQEEFEEKFKWEKGGLFINNTKVEGDLQPIFQGDTLRVPIREILEGYGFDVNWDMENKVILAYRDGIEYAILLGTDENMRRLKIDEYESDVIQVQFFESVFFKDDNIYVGVYDHLWELMGSLGVSGYKCNVDYNNKDVYLSGTINN